jgi:hypothetical protein
MFADLTKEMLDSGDWKTTEFKVHHSYIHTQTITHTKHTEQQSSSQTKAAVGSVGREKGGW